MSQQVLVGFLKAGRVLDRASSVLLLAALLLAPAAPLLAVAAATALGLLAKYLAWRVALDAEFFQLLDAQPAAPDEFDLALAALLGRPVPAPRTMPSRVAGARRLLVRQAVALGLQVLAVGVEVALGRQG